MLATELSLPRFKAWRCVFVSDEIYEALDRRFLRAWFSTWSDRSSNHRRYVIRDIFQVRLHAKIVEATGQEIQFSHATTFILKPVVQSVLWLNVNMCLSARTPPIKQFPMYSLSQRQSREVKSNALCTPRTLTTQTEPDATSRSAGVRCGKAAGEERLRKQTVHDSRHAKNGYCVPKTVTTSCQVCDK